MSPASHKGATTLSLVRDAGVRHAGSAGDGRRRGETAGVQEVDWSILMARAQGGDAVAYRRLLEQVAPYLRSLAYPRSRDPADVEDAVQDVLLTIHVIRHTYDPTRPFGPWLLAIADRRLIDRRRRQGRRSAREVPLEAEHESMPAEPTGYLDDATDGRDLRNAVGRLPPGQRQAIDLLKLREMSLKEAATSTGLSVAALKVATHRAVANLRKLLGGRIPKE